MAKSALAIVADAPVSEKARKPSQSKAFTVYMALEDVPNLDKDMRRAVLDALKGCGII